MVVASGLGAAALLASPARAPADALVMTLVCAAFVATRLGLTPLVSRARDAHLAGDDPAGRRFGPACIASA